MQKITTFLTYDDQAEEAARLYVSIFEDNCRVGEVVPGPEGKVMNVTFELFGQTYVALNAGPSPEFRFSNGVSLMVHCKDQAEVDRYWDLLTRDGGKEVMCGWCKDKFGLPWQIVPDGFFEMIKSKDRAKAGRAMQAMMKMKKLDLPTLTRAFDSE